MFSFIDRLIEKIIAGIGSRGPLAVFIGGLVEQIIIPIPSPLITMSGGFLLIPKEVSFFTALKLATTKVVLPYTLAATLGLGIVYFIAYFGGKPLIDKFKGYLGFSWQEIEHLKKKFHGNWWDEILIVVFRAIPVIPISVISGVCGAMRLPIIKFYLASALGVFIRSYLLSLLGWQTGEAYQALAQGLDKAENIATILILIVIGGLLFWGYRKRESFLRGKKN